MNRAIKFRVWDLDNKKWHRSPQLVIRPYSGTVTDGATTPNVKLLQYTGLKDKNGVEIYEGDIIKYKDYSGGGVIFGGEQPRAKGVIEIQDLCSGMYYLRGMGKLKGEGVEVIGNIYEHRHLLEVK